MPGGERTSALLQHLHRVFEAEATRQLSDGEALRRFAALRDEAAFAALMHRHGPLVLGVCRHLLRDEHDAEDAFQATFLVLARQAGFIRRERSVASWLYGVASRIAMKARRSAARRRRHESQAPALSASQPASDLGWRELQGLLDEELNRLPEKYRTPFVLCCLESRSKKEAAEALGWKEGTVSSRLAQARKLLQKRLARRGVELGAVLAGLAVAQEGVAIAVSPALAAATLQAGLAFAAGGPSAVPGASAQALAWARAVLRGLALARAKIPAALVLLVALVGGGAAALLATPAAPPPGIAANPEPGGPRPNAPLAGPRLDPGEGGANVPAGQPGGATMTVAGRVLVPGGQPAPGARVTVLAAQYRQPGEPFLPSQAQMKALGSGTADDKGKFRLSVPQTTVSNYRVTLLASAPGYAPMAVALDRLDRTHDKPVQLELAQSVRGRLLGPGGEPARGVRLEVTGVDRGPGGLHIRFLEPPGVLPAWPGPVITDNDGRFVLRGLGPNLRVDLEARDERYATQRLSLRTGPAERANLVTLTLAAARTLDGRITAEDTGRPLAGAAVVVQWEGLEAGTLASAVHGRTDADGRFRLRPFPGAQHSLRVYPAAGSPYFATRKQFRWPAGAARHELALALRRGVLLHGRVKEAGTGLPVAGAAVEHIGKFGGPDGTGPAPADPSVERWHHDTITGPDGTFALAGFPGRGHLLVRGPTPDYLHVETSSGELDVGSPGGRPYFPDALVSFELPRGTAARRLYVTLRRGVTVRGRVIGRDGKPVASALLLSPTYRPGGRELTGEPLAVRDGRFELPGCDPQKRVPVWVFDARGQQGAYVEVAGKADEEPVIRLAPSRIGRLRPVGRDGKPLARPGVRLDLVLRPGAAAAVAAREGTAPRITVAAWSLYGAMYQATPSNGGTFLLPWLVPGAPYVLRTDDRQLSNVLRVPPGDGLVELGDVAVAPQEPNGR